MSGAGESGAPDEVSLPLAAVVMAVHKPVIKQLSRQVASLLAQDGVRLGLVAVLDGAETAGDAELRRMLEQAGFAILVNEEALGAPRAFAAGLTHALETFTGECLFAYCDQDDVWRPQKLSRLSALRALTRAELVHCDARVVDDEGRLIAASLHDFESREEPRDLLQHLLLNGVTGMTALFTRRTAMLATALIGANTTSLLHDHLTALAAASLGATARLAEPLVDYVQHAGNSLGAKPHLRAWQHRTLGVGPLSLYRATSKEMFAERRSVARMLAREGVLPPKLEAMFLTRRPGFFAFEDAYISSIAGLLRQGQFRRAMLCVRMWDAAFSCWVKRG